MGAISLLVGLMGSSTNFSPKIELHLKRAYRIKEVFLQLYSANSPVIFSKIFEEMVMVGNLIAPGAHGQRSPNSPQLLASDINWVMINISNGIKGGVNSIYSGR